MAFHLINTISNFLFKGWTTHTVGNFVGVCLFVAVLSFLVETFKVVKFYLTRLSSQKRFPSAHSAETRQQSLVPSLLVPPSVEKLRRKKIQIHVGMTFLHVVELVFGYLLMLTVMTYNGWIAITVVTASGIWYYFLGWLRDEPPVRKSLEINSTDTSSSRLLEDEEGELTSRGMVTVTSSGDTPSDPDVDGTQRVSVDVHL